MYLRHWLKYYVFREPGRRQSAWLMLTFGVFAALDGLIFRLSTVELLGGAAVAAFGLADLLPTDRRKLAASLRAASLVGIAASLAIVVPQLVSNSTSVRVIVFVAASVGAVYLILWLLGKLITHTLGSTRLGQWHAHRLRTSQRYSWLMLLLWMAFWIPVVMYLMVLAIALAYTTPG